MTLAQIRLNSIRIIAVIFTVVMSNCAMASLIGFDIEDAIV